MRFICRLKAQKKKKKKKKEKKTKVSHLFFEILLFKFTLILMVYDST